MGLKVGYLLGNIIAIDVNEDPNVDGEDWTNDAEQGNTGKLVDNLDTKEDDGGHEDEHGCSIDLKLFKLCSTKE